MGSLQKFKIYCLVIVVGILVVGVPWGAITLIKNSLKNKYPATLNIIFTPLSSVVQVDGRVVSAGLVRVKPGTHTVKFSHQGFQTKTEHPVAIANQTVFVGAILVSNSDSTRTWYDDHLADAKQQEAVNGAYQEQLTNTILTNYPLTRFLPYTGAAFEYKVDYGSDPTDPTKVIFYVTVFGYNFEQAKQHARDWIASTGTRPTDIKIIYKDDSISPENR